MTWAHGYVELDCGTQIGIEKWDSLYVGAEVFCPKHRKQDEVKRMSRIFEARPSRDAQLGIREVSDGDARAGAGEADQGAAEG